MPQSERICGNCSHLDWIVPIDGFPPEKKNCFPLFLMTLKKNHSKGYYGCEFSHEKRESEDICNIQGIGGGFTPRYGDTTKNV